MSRKLNLIIEQGASFSNNVPLKDSSNSDIIVAGHSGSATMSEWYSSTRHDHQYEKHNFDVTLTDGNMELSLSANTSGDITAGRYVYYADLNYSNGHIQRIVSGNVTVNPKVS